MSGYLLKLPTLRSVCIALIRFYQYVISPMRPPSCRYYPSCSQYAIEATERFGAFKGTWFAVKRILRCHPGCDGGYDPVPEAQHTCCNHTSHEKSLEQ